MRNDQLAKIAKTDCLEFKTVRLARRETRRIGFRLVQQSAAGIAITAEQLDENTDAGVASRLPASRHVDVIHHNCNNIGDGLVLQRAPVTIVFGFYFSH